MRACRCCLRPLSITPRSNFRTWIEPGLFYMVLLECECGGTMGIFLWEAEDFDNGD